MTSATYMRGWRLKNRESYNAYQREYRARRRETINAARREQWKRDPARFKGYSLKRLYGLTGEQYVALVVSQKGLCAVCLRPPRGKRGLVVDHCHKTGVVRGLLCNQCNGGVGKLDDSPALLEAAAKYLRDRVNGVFPTSQENQT